VSFAEEQIDLIRTCDAGQPAELELTIYPDADHAEGINPTYDLSAGYDIYAWLLQHTRN
jgi:hypothetical protein